MSMCVWVTLEAQRDALGGGRGVGPFSANLFLNLSFQTPVSYVPSWGLPALPLHPSHSPSQSPPVPRLTTEPAARGRYNHLRVTSGGPQRLQ